MHRRIGNVYRRIGTVASRNGSVFNLLGKLAGTAYIYGFINLIDNHPMLLRVCVRDRSGILFRLLYWCWYFTVGSDEKDTAYSPTQSFYGGSRPNAICFFIDF